MSELAFRHPLYLLLLLPWAALAWYYRPGGRGVTGPSLSLPSAGLLPSGPSWRARTYPYLVILRFLSILLFIIALAAPGRGITYSSVKNFGVDIMIAMDLSGSMLGEDFHPRNRLLVAKESFRNFIAARTTDRIGMVIFAGEAYLQCPLTSEYGILSEIVADVDAGAVEEDGTAVGDALALAASRLGEDRKRGRVILLLTDGRNNRGTIDPETAAGACADMGIRVYSIGIGTKGAAVPYPTGMPGFKRYMRSDLDDETLKMISEKTGGRYYNAVSPGALSDSLAEIDRLEKTGVTGARYSEFIDGFSYFLVSAVILFFVEMILRAAVYRKVP